MEPRPSGFGVPAEWQDPRPPLPWRAWLIALGAAGLLMLAASFVIGRLTAPPPPKPLSAPVQATREITRLTEETRGAESLYVMLESAPDRRAMQAKMTVHRGRLTELVASLKATGRGPADQERIAELDGALQEWWAVQDQMFEALQSKMATRDDLSRARLLVAVDSQRSYQRLLNIMDRWAVLHGD